MIRRKDDGSFTLKEKIDGKPTESARPPSFSFPDKYGKYRRKTKKNAEDKE